MLKRTALFDEHQRLGGRLIDFGGWELPVQFSGVIDEHETCRNHAGIFDVSHMGEIHVEGNDSTRFLDFLLTNHVAKLAIGQAQYSVMCHETGGIVDDLVVYRRGQNRFLVVVNASNTDKDFRHMLAIEAQFKKMHSREALDLKIENVSSNYTQIALQGRNASQILSQLTPSTLSSIKTYWFTEDVILGNIPAILSKTGYTGEDGFEIYIPWDAGPEVWRMLLKSGSDFGLKPCGLGARDTLRLEMKYPLYGNDLTDTTHPLEAGLNWVVKIDKGNFVGREALLKVKESGIQRLLVGIKLLEKGIPRHGYSIFNAEGSRQIGEVTSGSQSPSLKQAIGIGYIEKSEAQIGSRIAVEIRGMKIPGEVVATPFYKRPY